jgi:hypothetical protein
MSYWLWGVDWMYGIPMLLGSLAFHVSGLVGVEMLLRSLDQRRKKPRSITFFLLLILLSAVAALVMHVLEASTWATLYWRIGALPDFQTAMLYSFNALTAYGHEAVMLKDDWRLLGAIESMNGVIIFGLTTAYLFNAMGEFRPARLNK